MPHVENRTVSVAPQPSMVEWVNVEDKIKIYEHFAARGYSLEEIKFFVESYGLEQLVLVEDPVDPLPF